MAIDNLVDNPSAVTTTSAWVDPRAEFTVEENIDFKIKILQDQIKKLQDSKASIQPLLSMKICDIHAAMTF